MLKKRPVLSSAISSFALLAYIYGVSWIMNSGEELFGDDGGQSSVILILCLLVFSALVCGLLLLGGPIYLYLEGNKKTAFKMLGSNIFFLGTIVIAAMLLKIYFRF